MLKKVMIAVACGAMFISGCSAEKSDREDSVKIQDAVQGSADDSGQFTQAVEVVQDVGPDGRPVDPTLGQDMPPTVTLGEEMEVVVEEEDAVAGDVVVVEE